MPVPSFIKHPQRYINSAISKYKRLGVVTEIVGRKACQWRVMLYSESTILLLALAMEFGHDL